MTERDFLDKGMPIIGSSLMFDEESGTISIDASYVSADDLEQLAALLRQYLRARQSQAAQYLQTVDKGLIVDVKV